jgi:tetratricopeptide (TPR) repeat protein
MNRTSHLFIRLAGLAAAVLSLTVVAAGPAAAQHPWRQTGGAPGSGYEAPIPAPAQSVTDNSDRTLQWVLFAAAVVAGLAVVAIVADVFGRRRWRRPPLKAALESSLPDELPRAAGLLGDLFVQQHRIAAAEHAYRAAIDGGDAYLSPIAQVALAQLLSDRGERTEAQALLEAAIASGHARAVPAAQAGLSQLSIGEAIHAANGRALDAYEILSDPVSARRS